MEHRAGSGRILINPPSSQRIEGVANRPRQWKPKSTTRALNGRGKTEVPDSGEMGVEVLPSQADGLLDAKP